ncbi:MAG: acyltransferase domain-containing protein, partial [Candidatus Hydrogenedentes bacterium]|nr:acyltransferase domain-containing protein [Candidatus Hydrogenedentota bacterium]
NTTNFNVRWSLLNKAAQWAKQQGGDTSPEAIAAYLDTLRDAMGPALSANRTMGALASVVASRIARELRCGGPSFALSSEECSGMRALEAAVRALQQGELNNAIVGAVDLAGDVRAMLGTHSHSPYSPTGQGAAFNTGSDGALFGEGATAFVLKRLEDAERDGDIVYGVIKGLGNAAKGGVDTPHDASAYQTAMKRAYEDAHCPASSVAYVEANGSGIEIEDHCEADALAGYFVCEDDYSDLQHCYVGSAKNDIGHTGAVAGLAGVLKATLCLYHEMIPPLRGATSPLESLTQEDSRLWVPEGAQYWIHDEASGPRRAAVSAMTPGGNYTHIVLEQAPNTPAAARVSQPLGDRDEALFVVGGESTAALLRGLDALKSARQSEAAVPIEAIARSWWRSHPLSAAEGQRHVSIVTRSVSELLEQIDFVRQNLEKTPEQGIGGIHKHPSALLARDRIFYSPAPLGTTGKVAFVFPGSGNHYAGMGRELFAQWPAVLQQQHTENDFLRQQYQSDVFWKNDTGDLANNHKALIFGHVSLCTGVSDLVRSFGIEPQTVIGYSLGETAGLFSMRAWRDRDLMLDRIADSRLFTHELAGECDAARRAWQLPGKDTVDWVLGVIDRPMKVAKQALKRRKKVYPLIATPFQESVRGGNGKAVEKRSAKRECQFIPVEGVTTVHCDIVKEVEKEYRDLHLFQTTPPQGVQFYSGAWGKAYPVTREKAADSVLAQAIDGVDFPAVIENAYEDGVRFFIEVGPGNSCSRMCSRILADKPHLSRAVCYDGQDATSLLLRTLGHLVSEGFPVNLEALYGHGDMVDMAPAEDKPMVGVQVGGDVFVVPKAPRAAAITADARRDHGRDQRDFRDQRDTMATQALAPGQTAPLSTSSTKSTLSTESPKVPVFAASASPLIDGMAQAEAATAAAHAQYLAFAESLQGTLAEGISWQMQLLNQPGATLTAPPDQANRAISTPSATPPRTDIVFSREQCMEFAIGSIGKMLGAQFAAVDTHPTRVRLPDEPLMLVDRITALEGEPCSMTSGRVVTEHDVLHDGWYLDGGHLPTCIAVEAGQADLFLSGYLGIDFETKGRARYRLLDAEVTFHDHTPMAGQVIRYDIHIDQFFRHGNPWFFKFHFDATIDGKLFLTMRDGIAGFFTDDDLAAGQGVVDSKLDLQNNTGVLPADWVGLAPMSPTQYSDVQVNALRVGNLAGCFGELFKNLPVQNPVRIPDGKMNLVHRVLALTPGGGRFGLGKIVAEADIHPDDWFITCHFVDDKVMPGTLMFECCLHTLRIYLMRMGWVAEADTAYWEPRPGVTGKLKCRGQVLETTKKVTYEIVIKELGYGPQPYAIADARMYADGKAIVDIGNMSIQLQGQTREALETLWQNAAPNLGQPKPAIYDYNKILAYSQGNPSEGFGAPYTIFDEGQSRRIARLPRPPYQFLDRVTAVTGEPFVLEAGAAVEAQYDIPADEWYFAANRQDDMPFAVLLEVALQPCGWLAAYCGSALTSDEDLKFRNLGGKAIQHLPVTRNTGCITVQVKMTGVSNSGGMIIQHYHMAVHGKEGCIYEGTTYFGFFSQDALAEQVGIRDAAVYEPTEAEVACTAPFSYPNDTPAFPDAEWSMVDEVTVFDPTGGPNGLGFIRGITKVNPDTWFFKAHFYQDPVCPGSLGLESFVQLLKLVAKERWGADESTVFETLALGQEHEWVYRGQIIPTDDQVTVQAVVTAIDDEQRMIHADGFLIVDGRVIYQMKRFTLQLRD